MSSFRFASARVVALFFLLSAPIYLEASTAQIQTYFDTDNNVATGCTVALGSQAITGVEQVLTTSIEVTSTSSSVTGVTRALCDGSVFGSPLTVNATGWPIGTEGASGVSHIETHIPVSAFGTALPAVQRLYFVGTTGAFRSSLLTAANNSAILYPYSPGRRHAVGRGDTDPRSITLDGQVGDWNGIQPLVAGGASGGITAISFQSISAFAGATDLFFLFDTKLNLTAPIAVDDTYEGQQGNALNVAAPGVLTNDISPTGAALSALLVSPPEHGTVSLAPTGAFNYVNDGASAPVDHFTYKANDGTADSNTATVTINVSTDNAPNARADSYSVPHGGTLTVPPRGVLINDDDPDGDALTASLQTGPQHGTLTLNSNGSFTYTHDGSNSIVDTFRYRASDGIKSSTALVTITIGPDVPPVAVADAYTVAEGGTLVQPAPGVLGNDSDADSPQALWTANLVTGPLHGTLTLNANGSFTYVHDGSETTSDSFTYVLNDGIVNSAPATVTITITPVNDAPVAVADSYTTSEDTALNVAAPGVLGNDTDADIPPQTLTSVLVSGPSNGTLTLNADGSFTYTPNPNYNGTDSFTYNVNDGVTSSATPATVTITITAVNDPPVFTSGGNVTVNEDTGAYSQPWATGVSAGGGADEAGQTLTFNITGNTNPALFSVQPSISAAGVLTFTPAANANGVTTITVFLQDNGGGTDSSAPVTFTITVNAVNDAPTFSLSGNPPASNEDAGPQTVAGFATGMSAGPADEAGQTVTFSVTNNSNPSLFSAGPSIDPVTGTLTYTAAADAFGTATITVVLQDNGGTANGGADTSAPQTFTITVNPVNDAPSFTTGGNVTGFEDTAFSQAWATAVSVGPANESSQTATFNVTNNTNPALFATGPSISAAGVLTFTPAVNASGSADVTIVLQDNGGTANGGVDTSAPVTFTITVTAVNDAPSFTVPPTAPSSNEDAGPQTVPNFATAISAGPADEAGQTLTFNVTNNSNPSLFSAGPSIDAGGTLTYTAAPDAFGTATITVVLQDNGGTANGGVDTSAPQTFTITVNAVNDPPTFTSGGNVTGFEDTVFSQAWATAISAGAANESGQTLTFIVTGNTNPGLFAIAPSISAAGVLSFSPAANANGSADITVALQDNGGGTDTSAPVTFTITITAVNDAPSFTVPAAAPASNEDAGPQTLPGFATAISPGPADEAGQTVTFNVTGNSNPGLFSAGPSIDASGTLTYTATADIGGTATITVVAQDNGGTASGGVDTSAPQTFTITVVAVNDPPTITAPASVSLVEDTTFAFTGPNAISVADPDAGSGNITVNLESSVGGWGITLVGSTSGCCIGSPSLTITGTLADVNASLATLTTTPTTNFNGASSFTINVNDNGNTGAGGPLFATATVPVTVAAVDDPPVNVINPTATTNEDTALNLSTINNGVNVSDVDAGGADIQVQFTATNGTLFMSNTSGLTSVTGNGTNVLTLVGPQSAINSDLLTVNGGLVFNPTPDFNGSATVQMVSNDLGNSGAGGPLGDTDSMTITVNAVNDAPVNTLPAPQTVNQDSTLTLSNPNNISVGDVDSSTAQVTLAGGNGTITLSTATGLSFSAGDGTADATMTFTGLITDINAALNGMQFTPTPAFFGGATITITTNDQGNTGSGGALQDVDTLNITVLQVNQPPVNTVPGAQTVNEDAVLTFSTGTGNAISTSDPDAGAASVQISLGVLQGTLHLVPTAGVTINNNDTPNVTATGSIANLNTALNGLTYTPAANYNGPDTLTFTTDDLGNTGPGGAKQDTDTVAITVNAVNDDPTDIVLSNSSVDENQPSGTTVGTLSDVDADIGDTATFTLVSGTGSTDNASFTIVGNQLQTAASFDFETQSSFSIRIRVTDSAAGFFEKQFTITVNNVNETPTDVNLSATTIAENNAVNAVVGTFSTTDPDSGDTFTYTLVAGAGSTDNASFNIAGNQLRAGSAFNFEVKNSYSIRVRTTDAGGLFFEKVFTITVTDVNEAPVAGDETYANVIGNTTQKFGDGGGTMTSLVFHSSVGDVNPKANDTDPDTNPLFNTLNVVPVDNVATNAGGKISIDADGTFSYTPPPGFTGSDFYDYTISDGTNSDVGRMTFTVSNLVWYVKNDDAGAPFTGTSQDPFNTLAQAAAATPTVPGTANTIYVFKGDGTNTGMNSGIALDANQNLIGAASDLIIGADTLVGGNVANRPLIGNSGGDGVNVTANANTTNLIKGLSIAGGGGAGNGIDITTTAGTDSFTIDNVVVTGSVAEGIDVNAGGGTVTVNLSNLDVTAGTTGIDINRTLGTADVATFSNITISGNTGGSGILINNVNVPSINAGTVNVGTNANHVGSAGISLTSVTGGITFNTLNVFADGPLGALVANGVTPFSLATTSAPTLLASAGPAVNFTNVASSISGAVLTSSGSPATGVSLTNVTGTFDAANSSSIQSAGTTDFVISGGSATVTYAGTIYDNTGQLISVSGSSGTKTFSGAIDDLDGSGDPIGGGTANNGGGISLSGNTGTIRFNGGLDLSTGSTAAFAATGGGTVEVCDEAACTSGTGTLVNQIVSTTGTALNVTNTTIGAGNLEFRSISANGAVNGIVLNTTGSSGGLKVKGNSSGTCGGSISIQPLGTPSTANAPVTSDCTGGTIQSTTGAGVLMTSTANVSLTRMLIQNAATGFDEMSVNSINGLTIDHCFITDNAGNAGDRGIEIGDFSTGTPVNGTITISNSTIGPTAHDNIGIGIGSGNSSWSFTNDVLTGSVLDSGMNFEVRNATVSSFLMDGCVVQNQFADGMQINPASGVNATISSATIQNSTFVNNNLHLDLNHDGASSVTYKVIGNTFRTSTAQAVNFFTSTTATGGVANGRFVNNRIGTAASFLSGGGAGFRINVNGNVPARVLIDSNVIRQEPNGRGIEIISRNGTGGTDATVTNNDVDTNFVATVQNGGFSLANIFMQSNCLTTCNTLRSNITGNTVPAIAPTGELVAGQIALLRSGASTNQLVDVAPASPDAASELASHNTGSTAVSGTVTLIPGPIVTPP